MSILLSTKFFPIVIMILFACAMVRYAIDKNWGQAIYWASAIVLNYAVTFMINGGTA